MFGIQLELVEERRNEMKLKVIALNEHNIYGNTAGCFLAKISKDLDYKVFPSGIKYMPHDIYAINYKCNNWIVSANDRTTKMDVCVSILEIDGYTSLWIDDFLKLVQPGCAWDIIYSPKTYAPEGDPTLRQIYIDKECIYDHNLDTDQSGDGELPLEYFFANHFLVEHNMKHNLFPEAIKIDEKYDLAKYESRIKKAFKEANTTLG